MEERRRKRESRRAVTKEAKDDGEFKVERTRRKGNEEGRKKVRKRVKEGGTKAEEKEKILSKGDMG